MFTNAANIDFFRSGLNRIARLFIVAFGLVCFYSNTAAASGCSGGGSSPTVTAPFTLSDIQTCWDNMAAGGTLTIGPGSLTLSSRLTFRGKPGTVIGATTCTGAGSTLACTDNTVFTVNSRIKAIEIAGSAAAFISVGGISINASNCLANNGVIGIYGTLNQSSYRFHHSHLTLSGTCDDPGWVYLDQGWGLLDHLLVDSSANQHTFAVFGQWSSSGLNVWKLPQSWGDANAVFLEDSRINATNGTDGIMDGFAGGRVVVRHNSFTFGSGTGNGTDTIAFHGFDSGGYRSFMTAEIYNNTYTNSSGFKLQAGRLRGGTALWHDNTFGGASGWNGISLQTYRTGMGCTATSYPRCNGTQYRYTADGNQTRIGVGETSKFCAANRDTPCASDSTCNALSGGDTCSAWVDGNSTGGYLCRDQPGTTHNQMSSPVYVWSNTGGVTAGAGCDTSYITSGRDFVNGRAPSGYSAYTYPHPLQNGRAAKILLLIPSTGGQGQASLSIAVVGTSTKFVSATTTCDFGANITVNSCTVSDSTHLTVNITIAGSAVRGTRDATFTTGGEAATITNGFTVGVAPGTKVVH